PLTGYCRLLRSVQDAGLLLSQAASATTAAAEARTKRIRALAPSRQARDLLCPRVSFIVVDYQRYEAASSPRTGDYGQESGRSRAQLWPLTERAAPAASPGRG